MTLKEDARSICHIRATVGYALGPELYGSFGPYGKLKQTQKVQLARARLCDRSGPPATCVPE